MDTSHPYLEVASRLGTDLYRWISGNPWVSEALYAPLLFPQQAAAAEGLAMKYVRQADPNIREPFDYKFLLDLLESQLANWLKRYDWQQYKIIGFSVCFHQLLASLAAASAIKGKHPGATIVFGGSSCGAGAGQAIRNAFHFIDYVIPGEGEKGLLALYDYIAGTQPEFPDGNIITGQTFKEKKTQQQGHCPETQLPALDDLPFPDYIDYFAEQKNWFARTPFIPVLPIEFSRGCWWNRCSFCNLNLQWCGYRGKKAAQMLQEVKTLAARHGCLDFTFVDNMLPPQEAQTFFAITGTDEADYNFFAEIRSARGAQLPAEIFPVYRRGGLSTVQVGIEAFSSSLLQKMQKGITVIENIATMRSAAENSLQLEGNLILQFPGSTQAEVDETLEILDYVFPYRPLAAAVFFLGFDSPIHREPQKFGIRAIVNHANNYKLFPKTVLPKLHLLVKDYRGDRVYQRRIWKPVGHKVKKWQQYHDKRKRDALSLPLLYYRNGGDFLLIRQELPDGKILHHRLQGVSRQIYIFCTRIRTETDLYQKFPAVRPEMILSFLADLQKKRILFSENKKYLSLAIHFKDK